MATRPPAMRVEALKKHYQVRKGLAAIVGGGSELVRAVDGVDLTVRGEEVLTVAGESGSGKTTLGKLMVKLLEPTSGRIIYNGEDITAIKGAKLAETRRRLQFIFQDPYESLNPRMTVYDLISEGIRVHKMATGRADEYDRVSRILERVGLTPVEDFMARFPHQLSGGQRQRVAIARALVLEPEFVVADEPVSMLDVSIRAEILNLLLELKERLALTMVFITHDLAVARHMSDRIAIMYLGKVVEVGSTEDIIYNPLHPYTVALLKAVPDPDPDAGRSQVVVTGEMPSAIRPPPGCRFHTRCPIARRGKCDVEEPPLVEYSPGHYAACHFAGQFRP